LEAERYIRLFAAACAASLSPVWCPATLAGEALAFSAAEIERILAHGPWPPPASRDPSNRASGKPGAVRFGATLFSSPRLSGHGGLLCASCHETWRAFSDGRERALGIEPLERNTPGLLNVGLHAWFGWDGANDNLWAQSIRPLLDPREMGSSAGRIAALVRGDGELSALYEGAFGASPPADDEAVLVDVGKALAAYQETLVSGRTPFDEFRDALAGRDEETAGRYPLQAQRGLRIFLARGCAGCHAGPGFTDGRFHRVGGAPDPGREGGVRKLRASRYNLLGPYNDAPSRAGAARTAAAVAAAGEAGAFRTPGLRHAALTAPYLHDGSLGTLCEVVRRHPERGLEPAASALAQAERRDLVAFLLTLVPARERSPDEERPASCP